MMPTIRWLRGWVYACAAVLLASQALADSGDAAQLDRMFRRSTLQIATPDARLHTFRVWVADDPPRRARGLMFVKHLEDDEGMLFIYDQPQPVAMWMKNTFIPLDMLFIDKNGVIIDIAERTVPQSTAIISPGVPARAVLEVNGGTAARLGLRRGDRVIYPAFTAP